MNTLVLYAILSACLFYLGSRAKITTPLWSIYPRWLAELADCAACSGTWYGLILALTVGRYGDLDFFGLPGDFWLTPIIVAMCTMVLTPMVAGVMQTSMMLLGSALPDEEKPNE